MLFAELSKFSEAVCEKMETKAEVFTWSILTALRESLNIMKQRF